MCVATTLGSHRWTFYPSTFYPDLCHQTYLVPSVGLAHAEFALVFADAELVREKTSGALSIPPLCVCSSLDSDLETKTGNC
jgi:hypothetical protein